MGRVSTETLEKLQAFLDSLPAEVKGKCALCNETLTHIVKKAEVETGAGTATVTRVLADEINDGAADGDRVSGVSLRKKVQRHEGTDVKCPNRTNNNSRPEPVDEIVEHMRQAEIKSEEWDAAAQQMRDAIQNAREDGWTSTTKAAAVRTIESFKALIN